jgi:hypothetical protein
MEVHDPPYPEYRGQDDVRACREYRVVFWEHQLPPNGSEIPPDQMGWAELTLDLRDAEDVQEAIQWAEANIDTAFDELTGGAGTEHGDRVYVLYVRVPGEDRYLHISGWVPVRDTDVSRL